MRCTYRWLLLCPTLWVAVTNCSFIGGCARPDYTSVTAEVRDADGQPTANGAMVTIPEPGGYEATARGYGDPSETQVSVGDDNRTGPFTVEVTKPYFTSATVDNIRTPADGCGLTRSASVEVSLSLLPDVPPVRQVVVSEGPYGFGAGNLESTVMAFVEAAPGVSREVAWSSSDPSLITVTPDGRTRTACLEAGGSATLMATSVADSTKKGLLEVAVSAAPPGSDSCY